MTTKLESMLTARERRGLEGLKTPGRIQEFLDAVAYRSGDDYICPLNVLRRREAHCFDGAVFGAAALRRLGYAPQVLYLIADRDDHHMLALFRRDGCWGAVSKSNFATLGLREPVYRSLRELVMSYFDFYYNISKYKSLRSYVGPLRLSQFDRIGWETRDRSLEAISDRLDWMPARPLLTRKQVRRLEPMGKRAYEAGLFGSDASGLYRPE